jgi:hypothetical protein
LDPAWAEACVHTAEPVSDPLNLIADRRQYQISRIILGRAVCRCAGHRTLRAYDKTWLTALLRLKMS